VVGGELPGCPRRDRVGHVIGLAAGQFDQFPVGVAAHPGDPVAQPEQPVEHLDRLGPGRDVSGEHDAVRAADVRLGQHRLEGGQHAVDVGQDSDTGNHQAHPSAAGGAA
jgi:hypothetical protein